ncbi:MAG: hypothetical protein M0Q43_07800 [Methanothrix sp.]|jgi:hypothetical protein|nr:hypothetical protein [Methanothrix sp.]
MEQIRRREYIVYMRGAYPEMTPADISKSYADKEGWNDKDGLNTPAPVVAPSPAPMAPVAPVAPVAQPSSDMGQTPLSSMYKQQPKKKGGLFSQEEIPSGGIPR